MELLWCQYVDEDLEPAFLVGSDDSMRTLGGCSLKRPDRLYASIGLVEVDECDEHQHRGRDNYSCEEQRISELYDEPSIVGKKMVVIRWNPHTYTPPKGYQKYTLDERMEMMVAMKKAIRTNPPKAKITVLYMFYDADNPNITQRLPRHMINSMADIARVTLG